MKRFATFICTGLLAAGSVCAQQQGVTQSGTPTPSLSPLRLRLPE